MVLYAAEFPSPVGKLVAVSDGEALLGLWIEGQKYYASTCKEPLVNKSELPIFLTLEQWLNRYFAGEKPEISELRLKPEGGAFRQEVWSILCDIPYGETTTYSEIAKQIAIQRGIKQMSAQAVGGAVGHNPISIIIPCHRVLGKDGSLTGYAGGVHIKAKLLSLEGAGFKEGCPWD